MLPPLSHRPLYLVVAERLRELIYQRALKPGDWIDELALSGQLGISRTPLREALKVLHSEELVELVPRRGCRVNALDEEALLELFPVMASLEGLCADLATRKLQEQDLIYLQQLHDKLEVHAAASDIDAYYEVNREFHRTIHELAGNRWLHRITSELRNVLVLARHRQLTMPGRLQASLEEHRAIMQALQQREPEAAACAMHRHLCRQQDALHDGESIPDSQQATA